MVVSVLITITCFLKFTTCNPYLSSIPSTNLPTAIYEATNISPGDINVGRDLQPKYSYNNFPQDTMQPVENVESTNLNKLVSSSIEITPQQVMPEQNVPHESMSNNFLKFSEFTPGISGLKIPDLGNRPVTQKNPNDISTAKYQHTPYSKTFNKRENLINNVDFDFKSKSRPLSPLKNVNANFGAVIKQESKFIEPQLKSLTTKPKDNFPEAVPSIHKINGLQNEAIKAEVLLPDDAEELKDIIEAENIPVNKVQISRVPYGSNGNPFSQVPKGNNFGILKSNAQQQEVRQNTPNKQQQTKMQPLKIPPKKLQDNSFNLTSPYSAERNLSQALKILNKNQFNLIDPKSLYSQITSDNQAIQEKKSKTDPRTTQVPMSRMSIYQNYDTFDSNSLIQTSHHNESLQLNPMVKVDPSSLSKLNIHNTLPNVGLEDKDISPAQTNFIALKLEENISEVSNPELNSSKQVGNTLYPSRAPYYNSFYQRDSRAFGPNTLLPKNHLSTQNKMEKVDPQHHTEEGNVLQKTNIATNSQEINFMLANPDNIIKSVESPNNKDKNISQNFESPYNNLYRPYSKSFKQQIKPENQSLSIEDHESKLDANFSKQKKITPLSQPLPSNQYLISTESPEAAYQPEILREDVKNSSQVLETTLPYYHNYYQPFPSAYSYSQQIMPRNHLPKLNQLEKANPHNTSDERNILEIYSMRENNSVSDGSETIIKPEQSVNYVNENLSQNLALPYSNDLYRPYLRGSNQLHTVGNQSLVYEKQTVKADPIYVFPERNVPQTINNVLPTTQTIPLLSPEIIFEPERNSQIELKNVSENFKTLHSKINQPFSRAFDQQYSDQLSKENQHSNLNSSNGVEKTQTPIQLHETTYKNSLNPSPKISNITSDQILQENYLEVRRNLQNENSEFSELQKSMPTPKNYLQVSIPELNQGALITTEEDRNEFQVLKEPHYYLDPFIAITTNTPFISTNNKLPTENNFVKTEPEIHVKYNNTSHNMVIDKSISQMQLPSETFFIQQQNYTESAKGKNLPTSPANKNYNLNNTSIDEDLFLKEPSIELFSQTQENLPEFVQQIHGSENMRTKNAVATPLSNLGTKNKASQPSHFDKHLENGYQTSRLSHFDKINPSNLIGSNQHATPYNEISENSQAPKTNQNNFAKASNLYSMPNNEFSIKKEAQAPLISQQYNRKYSLSGNPGDDKMDNKVLQSFDTSNPTNFSPFYNGGVAGYELQNTRMSYHNSFDPFIPNQQISYGSQRKKDNTLESSNKDQPIKENYNNKLPDNSKGSEGDSEILRVNIPVHYQEKLNKNVQGNVNVKNEITKHSGTQEPETQDSLLLQDISRVENKSQANTIPNNNYSHSYKSNLQTQQLYHDNQKINEEPHEITMKNQHRMPKLDININVPNADDVYKNIPVEITITEKPYKSCAEEKNYNVAQNITIDINNGNENFCKNVNVSVSQKVDEITNIGDISPCFMEDTSVMKENTTDKGSNFKEIVPSSDLKDFSSYLAETILSAVQSFLIRPNCSSPNRSDAENNDTNNSSCNCSNIESSTPNISKPVNIIIESALPFLTVKEDNNCILSTSATKQQCPGISEKNEAKNDTLLKVTPCLESNLQLSNGKSKICPALNREIVMNVTPILHDQTEPCEMTKDLCKSANDTLQIPLNINNNSHSDILNQDGEVIETNNNTLIHATTSNDNCKTIQNIYENPSNTNNNEIPAPHQSPQVLLPYYYYIDHINEISSETKPAPNLISQVISTSEEDRSVVICHENDTATIPTVPFDDPVEVRRKCYGSKPCLSKITVNIMPIAEKSNHDIVVFI